MVVGFNHNFRYKGEVYHIQTEDSGMKSPNIVTLLYQGGTILASKKTSYADIAKVDNLEQVVEELMKEQHKDMLRGLKSGEFDVVIERQMSCKTKASGRIETPQAAVREELSKPQAEEEPLEDTPVEIEQIAVESPSPSPPVPPVAVTTPPVAAQKPEPEAAPKTPPSAVPAEKTPSSVVEISLDEVILSYLMGDDK